MAGISYIRSSAATSQKKRKKPRPATAKPGIGYIRNATKRAATPEAVKPPAALVGIDYIRNNTKREVDARQKAANAAARAARPTGATPQASAPGVSGGGNAPSYVDTVTAGPNAAGAAKAKKAKDPKAAVAAAPVAATENPIDALYNAAGRQLDKQERAAQLQLEARLADQKAFDEYVARVRGQANTTLNEQFAASAANAERARNASLATVQGYTDQAIAAAGGNQSVLDASGVNANMASAAFNVGATGLDSAATQQNQQSLTEYQTAQSERDLARSANMRSEGEADRRATMSEIAQRRFDLSQEQAKAKLEKEATDRQYELDSIMADYVKRKGEAELGVAQYNAETERLGTRTPEERARELEIEASRVAAQNAKDRATASGKSSPSKVAQDLTKWVRDELKGMGVGTVDEIPDGPTRIDTARRAVNQLAVMHPNLTVQQAVKAMRGNFPNHVLHEGYPQGDPRNRVMAEIIKMFS